MSYCNKCGTSIPDGETFCSNCSKENGNTKEKFTDYANSFINTPDSSDQYDQNDIENNKGMAIISYIGILFIIPLLCGTNKTSPFAKFHINQGLVLFIVEAVFGVAAKILAFIPLINILIWLICLVAGVLALIFMIIGIINAAQGKVRPLPVIGGINILGQ